MTNKETVERNIGLTFDFVNYLMEHPEKLNELPDSFTLEFAEKDFVNKEINYLHTPKMKQSKVVRVRNTFEFSKNI